LSIENLLPRVKKGFLFKIGHPALKSGIRESKINIVWMMPRSHPRQALYPVRRKYGQY
jgi:hypothetical protein